MANQYHASQLLDRRPTPDLWAFPVEVSLTDLAQFFSLDNTDWESIASRRGDYNRLGYSLQRCTLRYLGAFLLFVTETPVTVVAYLARQLTIADPG